MSQQWIELKSRGLSAKRRPGKTQKYRRRTVFDSIQREKKRFPHKPVSRRNICSKMPNSAMNGHSEKLTNGHGSSAPRRALGYEMSNGSFLFTSESVGEGHPGKFCVIFFSNCVYVLHARSIILDICSRRTHVFMLKIVMASPNFCTSEATGFADSVLLITQVFENLQHVVTSAGTGTRDWFISKSCDARICTHMLLS